MFQVRPFLQSQMVMRISFCCLYRSNKETRIVPEALLMYPLTSILDWPTICRQNRMTFCVPLNTLFASLFYTQITLKVMFVTCSWIIGYSWKLVMPRVALVDRYLNDQIVKLCNNSFEIEQRFSIFIYHRLTEISCRILITQLKI